MSGSVLRKESRLTTILNARPLRLAFFAGVFLLLSVGTPWLIYRGLDPGRLSEAGRLVSAEAAVACLLLLVVYFAADGLRLHHTLRALGHKLSKRNMAKLVFINILFSNLTPMATGGGLAQVWYLRRHGVHYGTAAAATTVRTVLAMLLIFVPTPFAFALIDPLSDRFATDWVPALLGAAAALYLCAIGLVLARPVWLTNMVGMLLELSTYARMLSLERSRRWLFGLRRESVRFSRGVRAYLRGPRMHVLLSVVHTALFLFALFSFPALILFALGYDVRYWTTIGLMTVTTFIAYLAPTPGAAGVAEGAFALLFASTLGAADLVLAVVTWRFLTIYLGMMIGAVVTVHEIMRARRFRA